MLSTVLLNLYDFASDYLPQITCIVFLAIIYISYRRWMEGNSLSSKHRADGKVILITGANAGIGKATAIDLAKRGAKIIMACRDRDRSEIARQEIIQQSGNCDIHLMIVDLGSFKSIRSFVNEFKRCESHLDVLINNAGVMGMGKTLTEDGLEMNMAINHFGHFLLTLSLMDMLKKSKPSRIINVSSWGHTFYNFNKANWNSDLYYNRFEAYAQSKLANVMFTVELNKRIRNSGVTVNALHPGVVFTDLSRHLGSLSLLLHKSVFDIISKLFLRSPQSGAATTVYAALDFNLQTISGQYFDDCWMGHKNKDAENDEYLTWLWNKSEEVTGITWKDIKF